MAQRPVFIPLSGGHSFVREAIIDFSWNRGIAPSQKQKNIAALHAAATLKGISPVLEISTKSEEKLGKRLSAFNLPVMLEDGSRIPLECAFQGSKVFSGGGPFRDIFYMTSHEAKKDYRLRSSGQIVGFRFEGRVFPSEPKNAFYDWLYVRALAPQLDSLQELQGYAGFTDIEFNPQKSINCQARSCAVFVSLWMKDIVHPFIARPISLVLPLSYPGIIDNRANCSENVPHSVSDYYPSRL